ncbi:AbgT family transporter [Salibacterium qingdaonense]|uniref:Aminobenzoyl-glutamate transport protein n=1 Tax=Salibacterium qingdaonense TaxID=266892 RepID=A0A1I4KM34_9BACI|nr:AbgT family transporter [Salibacterium qingdaonense]SFL79606.1 aminobenzoyl-glutamate transport protein [Salibacterium qingdaonense]
MKSPHTPRSIKMLNAVEKAGNKLPHPVTIFILFTFAVIILSHILYMMGVSVSFQGVNDETLETEMLNVEAVSLLTSDGIAHMFSSVVSNFTSFVALGPVLVAMLGVGVAEKSGYISAIMTNTVTKAPKKFVTPLVVLMGVLSNVAASVGYVVLVPLGAIIFLGFRRHPLAGLSAAFAGVSGGYSANLVIGTNDPLLAGISTEAARIINAGYVVNPTDNWFFMFASTFLIVILGTLITDKLVEPKLGKYEPEQDAEENIQITPVEKKGLFWANLSILAVIVVIALLVIPENAPLRGEGGSIITSPFMSSIIFLMMLIFLVPGTVYGIVTKSVKNDKDVAELMTSSLETMAGFIVLIFFAAQFVALFNYTNLGTILAVKGAGILEAFQLDGLFLLVPLILITTLINLFIAADSAKWAIMAPVFVPMFMNLGIPPEVTQVAYRIGDASTNIISPLMPFFPLVVAFAQRYGKQNGVGTVISLMLPHSIGILVVWTIFFIVWYLLGVPVGPGADLTY